jgi:uncharacterized membrane protein YhhN
MRLDYRLFFFFVLSILELLGEALSSFQLIQIVKPLLMPALAFWWYGHNISAGGQRFWVIYALVFSTIGDIFLLYARVDAAFFLFGLVAFLVAHLYYIRTFFGIGSGLGYLREKPVWALPFFAFLGLLLACLWGGIPIPMRGAVVVYGLVITSMALSVLRLRNRVPTATFTSIMVGAVLFVLSDSLIAINKYGRPLPFSGVLIMATYILGQFGIVRGLLRFSATKAA